MGRRKKTSEASDEARAATITPCFVSSPYWVLSFMELKKVDPTRII
jgi:hypothetical protein